MASQPRWSEWIPELVLAAGLTVFLVDETDAATSAFKSGRAVALMGAAVAVWIAGRVVLNRLVPWRSVRTAVFGIAAIAALGVVVLPAYDDETVVEAFPVSSSPASSPPSPAPAPPPSVPTDVANRPVPPDVASSAPAARSDTTRPTPTTATSPTTTPPPPTTTTTTTTSTPGPIRLRTGTFSGIDHRATGTVAIYRAADGRHVIGLEEFDIQPGPDYDVYVVPGADRRDPDGGTRVDDLRGNRGTQYYEVPSSVDVAAGEWTVLIWCQTFGVPVANATPV